MNQAEILELMQAFAASGLSLLEIEQEDARVRMEKTLTAPAAAVVLPGAAPVSAPISAPTPVSAPQEETISGHPVKAPLVGVFYAASSPDAEPFVREGQKVRKGQVLCLIEAMKMMSELTAPIDGTISRILVTNGEVVSFDQVLFEVAPC